MIDQSLNEIEDNCIAKESIKRAVGVHPIGFRVQFFNKAR